MMLSKYLHAQSKAPLFNFARMGFASQGSAQAPAAVQHLEKDYYTILDIPVTATPEQIKDQYRKLAKKYHPDVRSSEKGQ
jgi:DnaJ-domain-containing protein 1